MSSTQYLTDATTRHKVFLQRYAKGESKEAVKLLNRLKRTINARLMKEPTEFQASRLNAVLKDINAISKVGFNGISNNAIDGAKKLAVSEGEFSTNLYTRATTTDFVLPADEMLIANVMQSKMSVGLNSGVTMDQALSKFSTKKAKEISSVISDGVVLGDTTQQIAGKLNGIISTLHKRQITALVSTMANHTSSVARKQVYKSNDDILDGYRWLATLDNKTTLICGSRDGERYPDESGFSPYPPAHWGCRSDTIPAIKPEYDLGAKVKGKRPAIGAEGVEQVGSKKTYSGWLKDQPKEFVDEALGVERSALFRSGKLKLSKFVDPTGKVYTLDQLKSMNDISLL